MAAMLFVTASLSHGGAERHAATLVKRLGERGHDVHLAYIKDEAALLGELRSYSGGNSGGRTHALAAGRYLDLRSLQRLAARLEGIRPAAIVAANGYALMYARLALRLRRDTSARVPLVATYHSTRLLGAKEQLQMLAYRPFFWTADCAVFVAARQQRYCMRRGILSRRNELIHNGVDTERFRDRWGAAGRRALRGGHGLSDTDYVIGMSGLLRPEKNHLQMVEAVALLRQRGLPARALFIGDGPMRGAIEARAQALGVGGHLRITGLQDDVRPHIAACDAIALCSSTEAFSLAALEAMSMSRPVVHSNVGGAAELIDSGEDGFLVPPRDTAALVARLGLLADRAVCEYMGRRARRKVEQRFSEPLMVARYERLLLELAQSNRTMPAAQTLNSGAGE